MWPTGCHAVDGVFVHLMAFIYRSPEHKVLNIHTIGMYSVFLVVMHWQFVMSFAKAYSVNFFLFHLFPCFGF